MMPPLLLLTDRHQLPPARTLVETVAAAAAAGADTVVLRELDLPEPDRAVLAAALAEHVRVVTARTFLPGAAGIHLSSVQTGLDGRGVPLRGRSCHGTAEVWRAVSAGADYVTLSPVAASASKPGYGPALDTAAVRRSVHAAGRVPVYALGGVDEHNAGALREAGVHGVAVMGSVMRADDPARVVARLREVVG
ncbi:MAG: thiamine phosphate synthase [Nocardioides sp.]